MVVDGLSFSGDMAEGVVKLALAVVDGGWLFFVRALRRLSTGRSDDAGLSEAEQREDEAAKTAAVREPPLAARIKDAIKRYW